MAEDSFDQFLETVTDSEENQKKIKEFVGVSLLQTEEIPENLSLV